MAVMSGRDTGEFRAARGDIRPELNHINSLIAVDGGLPIRAAGSLIDGRGFLRARRQGPRLRAAALKKVEERREFAQ